MTIAQTIKRMPTASMQLLHDVPVAGELIMDAMSNRIKIGDGKTALKDLPWIDYTVKEESSLSIGTKAFIEDHIDLIDNNDYDTLYSRTRTPFLAQEVTRVLLQAGLNPKPYLSKIPDSIKHILDPENVWAEDTSKMYTKTEMDAMLEEYSRKFFAAVGIPQNIMKAGI